MTIDVIALRPGDQLHSTAAVTGAKEVVLVHRVWGEPRRVFGVLIFVRGTVGDEDRELTFEQNAKVTVEPRVPRPSTNLGL